MLGGEATASERSWAVGERPRTFRRHPRALEDFDGARIGVVSSM